MHRIQKFKITALLAVIVTIACAGPAKAEITLGVEVRETYEDNVIGLVADNPNIVPSSSAAVDTRGGSSGSGGSGPGAPTIMQKNGLDDNPGVTTAGTGTGAGGGGGRADRKKGDFSTNLRADLGLLTDLASDTTLLLRVGLAHTAYSTFNQFNFTIASVSAGISQRFSDVFSGRANLKAASKSYDDALRESSAYGGSLSLRAMITSDVWLRGVYEYEQNTAKSDFYTYQGNSVGLWAGYALTPHATLGLGYSTLARTYKEPADFEVTSNTVTFDWTWRFMDGWSVNAGYDREVGDSSVPGTETTNNIFSIGLLYDY